MPKSYRKFGKKRINHVIIRGINKQEIFLDKQDKEKFIKEIVKTKEKYHYELYAYVLMPNHVHMQMYDGEENLPTIMNSIQTRYVSYFNKKYERVGHLFQGNYINKIIEDNNYFENNIRYIHQNPEKAGIEKKERYKWSSYNAYIVNDDKLVDINVWLDKLDYDRNKAIMKFKEFNDIKKKDKITDYIEFELQSKITDEQLIETLKNELGTQNIQNIQRYNSKEIRKMLSEIAGLSYVSISQLSRVTGISRKIISKIKKDKGW